MKIAVLTSGGDAPGMNAAVRAVTRGALAKGWEAFGVRNGYAGLLAGAIDPLQARDVGGIIQQGGTVLGSARSPEFATPAGRARAPRATARTAAFMPGASPPLVSTAIFMKERIGKNKF